MKTIDIKGKEYITVNERLKEFRNTFKDYSLVTEIIELGQDNCTMKATIIDDKGIIRATGYAREVIAKSPINKFAFVENCETSAVGRALGNFGIGIDTAVCSADELLMKLSQEEPKQRSDFEKEATAYKKAFNKAVKEGAEKAPEHKKPLEQRAKDGWDKLNNMTVEEWLKLAKPSQDSAKDLRDACLSSGMPELVDLGLKFAEKLKEFEPPLDDNVPY